MNNKFINLLTDETNGNLCTCVGHNWTPYHSSLHLIWQRQKKPTSCRLYGKNLEEFVGQKAYDYDDDDDDYGDDDDDDDDYGGGGNDYDYDIVFLQSATKCNFPYI